MTKQLTLAEECQALLHKPKLFDYRCPKCHGFLRSLTTVPGLEGHWRCYTCRDDYVMRECQWILVGQAPARPHVT